MGLRFGVQIAIQARGVFKNAAVAFILAVENPQRVHLKAAAAVFGKLSR